MITYSDKLTAYDFHAYIDHQLNNEECDEIESRLDNETDILQELQRCITINEKIQEHFDEVINETIPENILSLFTNHSSRPVVQEPKIGSVENIKHYSLDAGTVDALNAIDALDRAQNFFDNSNNSTVNGDEADTNIPVVNITPDAINYRAVGSQFNDESIDIENFLKGISEVDSVQDGSTVRTGRRTSRNNNMQYLYPENDNILVTIFTTLKKFNFISWLRRSRQPIQKNVPRLGLDFDLNINVAIKQTPKWQFWKNRIQNAADDAVDNVFEHIETLSPPKNSLLDKIKQQLITLNLRRSKATPFKAVYGQKYWILSGLLIGILLTTLLSSPTTTLGRESIEHLAIDSHLFFANEAINMIEAGEVDFKNQIVWLQKRGGTPLKEFDTFDSPFHKKGATLVPTWADYAGIQVFENSDKERITLYASQWNGEEDENIHCRIPNELDGLCTWVSNSMVYIVVGNLSLSRVKQFTAIIEQQT